MMILRCSALLVFRCAKIVHRNPENQFLWGDEEFTDYRLMRPAKNDSYVPFAIVRAIPSGMKTTRCGARAFNLLRRKMAND
jgi:hypothetical protein